MTTHIELARYIDHTALKPDTTEEQIRQLCVEADELGFAAVCVMPYWVPLCSLVLDELGASLAIATTIGFPNGSHQTVVKVAETKKAIYDGAQEIDMVINVGALRSGHRAVVMADMMAVAMSAHEHGALVKAIIETSLLNDDQKRLACELAGLAEAHADQGLRRHPRCRDGDPDDRRGRQPYRHELRRVDRARVGRRLSRVRVVKMRMAVRPMVAPPFELSGSGFSPAGLPRRRRARSGASASLGGANARA